MPGGKKIAAAAAIVSRKITAAADIQRKAGACRKKIAAVGRKRIEANERKRTNGRNRSIG
jgi:hypothetical protein